MSLDLKKFNIMGVVNITPDSFSDGGKLADKHKVFSHVQNLKNNSVRFFDFGAESTAPYNEAISEDEELKRFDDLFFSWLEDFDTTDCVLSFDTYRPSVFEKLYHKTKSIRPSVKIIWNDVSGVLEDELIDVLNRCPEAFYIYSHSNVPTRNKTSHHMNYVVDCLADEIVAEVETYFLEAIPLFEKHNLIDRVIFDPCFGFSKTLEQNLFLLKNFSFLAHGVLANYPWLIGISKKSFLRKSSLDLPGMSDFDQAEFFHYSLIKKWMNACDFSSLIFRLHDPNIYHLAQKGLLLGF